MNERQHIALTEAQIIAAEKGELQLETRDGRKVLDVKWFRGESRQHENNVLTINTDDGYSFSCYKTGTFFYNDCSKNDIFITEPAKPAKTEPKPLYEVGEVIEHDTPSGWVDVEYRENRNGQVCVFSNGMYKSIPFNNLRKKQKPRIYISGRITGLDYKEAFNKFEQAEKELTVKGYDVVNPMKIVPFNKDWSWFDYLSADIKLMGNCTHIYMLKNWRESGGASLEHEAAKWNNFAIIYQ